MSACVPLMAAWDGIRNVEHVRMGAVRGPDLRPEAASHAASHGLSPHSDLTTRMAAGMTQTMQPRRTAVLTTMALAAALVGTSTPVAAQDSGTVGATLTVADASACLTVTQTAVSYLDALDFSEPGSGAAARSDPLYAVDNCGSVDIDISVRGTDATATGPSGSTWALTGDPAFTTDCTTLDVYAVDVEADGGTVALFTMLTTTDQPAFDLTAGATATNIGHDLWMPCQGSSGAGDTMSFDVIYTAVVADTPQPTANPIVINEIVRNAGQPQNDGEWFEVHNVGNVPVDINGWTIIGGGGEVHTIANPGGLVVVAGGFLVLGDNADPNLNGGIPVDYQYAGIDMVQSGDFIELQDGPQTMDRVDWFQAGFPFTSNFASMSLKNPTLDNALGENWCESEPKTPGNVNNCP